jgi:TrmH family RNA methyltransferase
MKSVTSRDNAAYRALAKLAASGSERRKTGESVLDGAHLVAAFLDSGRKPEELMVDAAGLARPEVARLVERSAGARVTLLADALFNSISTVESPTGIVARVRTPQGTAVPADAPLVLLLEDIQDPGNVGALLRSAAAAGAGHVLLSPKCAFAWSPKVLRAAMGGHFALNIVEGADLPAFLESYEGASVALATRGERSLYDLDMTGPTAILIGNEGAGLSPGLRDAATVRAHIPMPGRAESLNAAAAGAVCLFEAVRQRTVSPA